MNFWTEALDTLNKAGLGVFMVILGGILSSLVRRMIDYKRAGKPLHPILKRGLGVMTALLVLGGESAVLRAAGVDLTAPGAEMARFLFVLQSNFVVDVALLYYLKVDLTAIPGSIIDADPEAQS